MGDGLRQRTIKALMWSSAERFGQQGIRFGITIVLARLLTPADFGLLGMVMVFTGVAEALINHGFGQALIQKQDVNENDLTTAFVISTLLAVILYGIMFLSAETIARFFDQSSLARLTRVVGFVIILDAIVVIQRIQYEKALDFRSLSKFSVVAITVSGIVGVTFALLDFGIWSLVSQIITQKATLALMLWSSSVWIPKGRVSKDSFVSLYTYGWKLQLAGLLSSFFSRLYALVIGRLFTVDIVGYYTKAKSLKDLPVTNLYSVVSKVMFPAFSLMNNDQSRLRRGYRTSITMLVTIAFPLMIGMAVTAERLIPFLLGNQWLPAIPFFQLLCLSGALYVLHGANLNILKVTGRTDLFLKLEIGKKLMVIAAIAISFRWGVYGLIIGQVITSYLAYFVNAFYSGRLINYSVSDQLLDILPYAALTLAMGGIVWLVGLVPIDADWIMLMLQLIVGVVVYTSLNQLFNTTGWVGIKTLWLSRRAVNHS